MQALDMAETKQLLCRYSVAAWGLAGAGGQADSHWQGLEELHGDRGGGGKEAWNEASCMLFVLKEIDGLFVLGVTHKLV